MAALNWWLRATPPPTREEREGGGRLLPAGGWQCTVFLIRFKCPSNLRLIRPKYDPNFDSPGPNPELAVQGRTLTAFPALLLNRHRQPGLCAAAGTRRPRGSSRPSAPV